MNLLLDIGNTRIKWAFHDGARFSRRGSVAHRDTERDEWLRQLPVDLTPARIVASNVAGTGVGESLESWAVDRFRRRVEFAHSAREAGGITNAYANPELLGVDRWLGMIGVRARCRQPFLLAAAGTAFTIDLVDPDGVHHGGVIVPGRSLMIETLKRKTGNIASAASAAGAEFEGMFGLNTAGAIESGATHALAALLGRAVEEACARYLDVRLFVYGGDAGEVFRLAASAESATRLSGGAESAEDVVLSGLAVLAGAGVTP